MKQHLDEIGIMRFILIISIVIGHTFTIYRPAENLSWPLPNGLDRCAYYAWINSFFIGFSLQAFVFVSGYLYAYQGTSSNYFALIKKKFKRLIIPSLIFGVAYILIIEQPNEYTPGLALHLLNGPGHLWFLPMLFSCFVIFELLLKIIKHRYLILLLICSIILYYGSSYAPEIMQVNSACNYLIFFIFGFYFYNYRYSLFNLSKRFTITLGLIAFILCYIKYKSLTLDIPLPYLGVKTLNLILGIIGSMFLISLSNILTKYSRVVLIGSWSGFFGVYLIHQFVIKFLYYHTSFLHIFHQTAPFVVLIITFLVSIHLSRFLLKTRFTRKLIS